MNKITPLEDIVIVRMIEQEEKIGDIILSSGATEPSTLGEVLIPNRVSYNRDGSTREPFLKKGVKVRIPKGKVGTGVPEAPKGETWLAIPEDMIIYLIIGEQENES